MEIVMDRSIREYEEGSLRVVFRSSYVGKNIGLNVRFVYIRMDALSVCECLI